jgi:hypothetical protein
MRRRGSGEFDSHRLPPRWFFVKRKKKPRFRAVTEVKAMARERVGAPPSEKIIPDPKTKPEKHPKRAMESEEN